MERKGRDGKGMEREEKWQKGKARGGKEIISYLAAFGIDLFIVFSNNLLIALVESLTTPACVGVILL